MNIILFDPSLRNNTGEPSNNLGDLIIHEFVVKILEELFPNNEIQRIATHTLPSDSIKNSIKENDLCFLGGTNILNSTINIYNNWRFDNSFLNTLLSKRMEVITLGVGWGEYQQAPNFYSKYFYKKRLSGQKIHSLRDSYSLSQFNLVGKLKGVNTSCPTTWWLNGKDTHRKKESKIKKCVFTLTDYAQNINLDNALLNELLNIFDELIYFPQGHLDMDYLNSLECYVNNKSKIKTINRTLESFKEQLVKDEVVYIGTRLHAGILALNLNVDALIISIDNRAKEMGKDIGLPIIERENISLISEWMNGVTIFKTNKIEVPLNNILTWKNQFK